MKHTQFTIVGAGLAGLSLAFALTQRGHSCIVIEKNDIGSGASGAIVGLANPATALNARLSWRAEECLQALNSRIESVQSCCSSPIIINRGLYRVASSPQLRDKFHKALETNPWPNDHWAEWLNQEQVKSVFPEIADNYGALYLPEALSISIPDLLSALTIAIKNFGGQVFLQSEIDDYNANSDSIIISTSAGEEFNTSEGLVWCNGSDLALHPQLTDIQLHGVLGQLDSYAMKSEFLSLPISSQGYMDQLPDGTLCVGSTYNHYFEAIAPSEKDSIELKEKFGRIFPTIPLDDSGKSSWVGVRTSTKDRMPVMGKIPNSKNEFLFGGFGSKGLLFSSYLSELYADFLIDGFPLPQELNVNRF